MKLQLIGDLIGAKVLVDHETQSVIIAGEDLPSIHFPIDHPYNQGTKLEKEARAALSLREIGKRAANDQMVILDRKQSDDLLRECGYEPKVVKPVVGGE